MHLTKEEIAQAMKKVKGAGRYAIMDLFMSSKTNVAMFNEMDKKGYELIAIKFTEAIFIKKNE